MAKAQGVSLVPLLSDKGSERPIFTERIFDPNARVRGSRSLPGYKSIIVGDNKIIYDHKQGLRLFDLMTDPLEQNNLSERRQDEAQLLLKRLWGIAEMNEAHRDQIMGLGPTPEVVLDDDTLQQLKALGYIH
jgi:hypothetical protein